MIEINIKKLVDNAVVPTYGTAYSAGMDLTATSMNIEQTDGYGFIEYGTGLSMEIPEGYVGMLFPRSSVSKTGMILANSVGIIDSDYRGEIKLRFKYIASTIKYEVGERIGQMIIMPFPKVEFTEVTELSDSVRGVGGFGSTN